MKQPHLDPRVRRIWERPAAPLAATRAPQDDALPGVPPPQAEVDIESTVPVAVILTAHAPYVEAGWLYEAIESIEAQKPRPAEKLLVLDGVDPAALRPLPDGWRVESGTWGNPNPARNLGLSLVTSPWVLHFDADNRMPQGYILGHYAVAAAAGPTVAFVYPDIAFYDGALAELRNTRRAGPFSKWGISRAGVVDTSSLWRRDAVMQVGGWRNTQNLDDRTLAMALMSYGWTGLPSAAPALLYRQHGNGRWAQNKANGACERAMWGARSLDVVTLLRGDAKLADRQLQAMLSMVWPRSTRIVLVDNSRDESFHRLVSATMAPALCDLGLSAMVIRDDREPTGSSDLDRHRHVAALYSAVWPCLTADQILTWEDDVEPVGPQAVRRLSWHLENPITTVGVVAGVYPLPGDATRACAARALDDWRDIPALADLGAAPVQVGFVGGGFTLWAGWAVHNAWPIVPQDVGGSLHGWDNILCRRVRAAGYLILLHEGVRCRHHCHGVIDDSWPVNDESAGEIIKGTKERP
jgi:hypothetical protein